MWTFIYEWDDKNGSSKHREMRLEFVIICNDRGSRPTESSVLFPGLESSDGRFRGGRRVTLSGNDLVVYLLPQAGNYARVVEFPQLWYFIFHTSVFFSLGGIVCTTHIHQQTTQASPTTTIPFIELYGVVSGPLSLV
jgi:hypothetical protein